MSFSVKGRFVDENGGPWEGFTVELRYVRALFDSTLGQKLIRNGDDGRFELSFSGNFSANESFDLIIYDSVKRELFRKEVDNSLGNEFNIGEQVIKRVDVSGFRVTLGKGTHQFMTHGNFVKVLIDNQAFVRASKMLKKASKSILLSQLFFDLPEKYDDDPMKENAKMIFKFGSPVPTTNTVPPANPNPRKLQNDDDRPERMLLDAARRNVDVKILLHEVKLPPFLLGGAVILFGFLVSLIPFLGFFAFVGLILGPLITLLTARDALPFNLGDLFSDIRLTRKYFDSANEPNIKITTFSQKIKNSGVMHVKMLIVDDRYALNFGSPFNQNYNDAHTHLIDEPRRGDARKTGNTGDPRHDVSFSATGPVVADMYELMKLLWNTAVEAKELETIQPSTSLPADRSDYDTESSIQIVRTLPPNRFDKVPGLEEDPELKDGEKGIHEAYLRAIANAEDFIYLENQYFTSDTIGDALIEAIRAKPKLQVIMLLNIEPDLPLGPWKQRRLITRINKAVSKLSGGQDSRFGVFTRWTHETTTDISPVSVGPRILPIYLHSKVGIVDNKWATIGSANLDGWSLDSFILSDKLRPIFGNQEQRAIEANALMFNDVDELPSTDAVDILRRRLWAEHLGYDLLPGILDENHIDLSLKNGGQPNNFLGLWKARADKKLEQLIDDPDQFHPNTSHILPWPQQDCTFTRPREHLQALGVNINQLKALKTTRKFSFKDGIWVPKSEAKEDLEFGDLEDDRSKLFGDLNDLRNGEAG